jgi:hypothetical protein
MVTRPNAAVGNGSSRKTIVVTVCYPSSMPRKPAPKPDDPEQSKRFIETAEQIEADKSPKAFERAFEKVAKTRRPLSNAKK